MKFSSTKNLTVGFTLIELLIVMAVIGVLAAVLLVAINPFEQLARGRDAGRKEAVNQLSHALQAYYISNNGLYPYAGVYPNTPYNYWMNTLVNSQDLKTVPALISYGDGGSACTYSADRAGEVFASDQNGYCYVITYPEVSHLPTDAIVYSRMESKSEKNKCPGQSAYFLWSSDDTRSGTVCSSSGDISTMNGFSYQ